MAYSFVAASSQYLWGNPTPVQIEPLSIFIRANMPSATFDAYAMSLMNEIDTQGFLVRSNGSSNTWQASKIGGTIGIASASGANRTANAWVSLLGVFSSTEARTIYGRADAEVTASNTSSASVVTQTLNIAIGALRRNPASGFVDGALAEAAIWNAALTADEKSSLFKDFAPKRIRPQSLVFYAPLIRNLQDIDRGLALTNNNGATVANHPRVY